MRGFRFFLKSTGIVVLILVIGLVVIIWQHEIIIRELLSYRISQVINNQPNSLYTYGFERLSLNVWDGDFELNNFTIQPRPEKLDSMTNASFIHKTIVQGKIDRFLIRNLRVFKFIRSGKLEIDSIQLNAAEVSVYSVKESKTKTDTTSIAIDIFNSGLKEVRILNISLDQFHFSIKKIFPDTVNILTLGRVDIELKGFYTDPTILTRDNGYNIAFLSLSVKGLQTAMVNNYQVNAGAINFDSQKNLLEIDTSSMVPSAEKMKTDNFLSLETRGVKVYNLDYKELVQKGRIKISKLLITEPHFKFNKPPQKLQKDTLRVLPAVTFRNIPFPICIDTIQIRNGSFNYIKEGFKEPKIRLEAQSLNLDGLHFTTDAEGPEKYDTFYTSGTTRFMNEADLQIRFTFPLKRLHDPFTCEGHMGEMDARSLNRIIKNIKGVKITSGRILSMDFNFDANDTLARGKMRLAYRDMKLQLVKLEEDDYTRYEDKIFLSFAANLAVNTNNDPSKSSFHEGLIYRIRDPRKTFLDYSIECLVTGLLTSMVPETKSMLVNKQEKKKEKVEEQAKEKK